MEQGRSRVPERAHFLWTGTRFPYGNRLAIESLLRTNPELEVAIHLFGKGPDGAPHFEAVKRRARVAVRRHDPEALLRRCDASGELWRVYCAIPAHAASAQSNLLRYAVLWLEGGVYLDFDILVLRSLRPLLQDECTLGTELVWRADEARVAGQISAWMFAPTAAFATALALRWLDTALWGRLPQRWHGALERAWSVTQPNNAVIAAIPKARFVGALLQRATEVDPSIRYRLGPTLVSEIARREPATVTLLPPEVLYFVPPSQSFRFFLDRRLEAPPSALLLHYVSSNHGRRLRALTPQAVARMPPSLFARVAQPLAALSAERPARS
jgi:Glycosyltransferase sugar-binding region containing DXD motif